MWVSRLPTNTAEPSRVHQVAQKCGECVQNKQTKAPHSNESQPFVMSWRPFSGDPPLGSRLGLIMRAPRCEIQARKWLKVGPRTSSGDVSHQPEERTRREREVSGSERRKSVAVGPSSGTGSPLCPSSSSSVFLQSCCRRRRCRLNTPPSRPAPLPLPGPPQPLRRPQARSSVGGLLRLLLHVVQLLDQGREGDPPLGRLLPAPAHQLVHLSTGTQHQLSQAANRKAGNWACAVGLLRSLLWFACGTTKVPGTVAT